MQNKISSIIGLILFGITLYATDTQWTLSNDDTYLKISVSDNKIYIDTLMNPLQGWNWVQSPSQVPLLSSVKISSTTYPLSWTYQDAAIDSTANGKIITLRFTSTTPNLELKSIWSVNPGSGPVENWITIENKTGGSVTYKSDIEAANIQISANNTVNLYRFDKTDIGWGKVYNDVISIDANITTNSSIIPYIMFDAGSAHGLYIGYEWELGGFEVTSGADPLNITVSANPISENVTQGNNEFFTIPNVYYGTYKGDIDDGSNNFKKWFWNYKITRSLYNNTNEPWITQSATPTGNTPQENYDYDASIGIECEVMDFWDGSGNGWYTNRDWMYHPAVWPSGFDFKLKANNAGMKVCLYMGGTYNDCNLSTTAGRDSELSAILNRYDWGWFDMWRTDRYTAPYEPMPQTYNGVKNFLYIHDYMISNRPDYRYMNCCDGGKYKGFAICRRMTFCTMNDEQNNAAMTRSTYYSNTYAINPVQLVPAHAGTTDLDYRTNLMGAMPAFLPSKDRLTLFKNKQRPILRGANIYHILPMADGVNWDGMESFNTTLNKGSVFLFKPSSAATDGDSKVIRLKGLENSVAYTLTFQERTNLNCVMTGAQLMNDGINVTGMSGDNASEIIWLDGNPVVTSTTPSGRCGAGTVTLNATASYGTLNWYADSTGGSSLGTGTSFTTPAIDSTTTYYAEVSDGGYISPRTAVTATISSAPPPAPLNTTSSYNQAICSGNTTTLSASGTGTLGWYSDSTGGIYLCGEDSFTTPPLNNSTTYYVQDSTCGPSATRTSITVKVYDIPSITSTTPSSRCGTGTVTLDATASAGKLSWYADSIGGSCLDTGTTYTTPSLSSSKTYYVEAKGTHNLFTYSEQFDNAAWAKGNSTVSANTFETTDPLGGNTADKFTEGTFVNDIAVLFQSFTIPTPNTCSVYLKKGSANWVILSVQGTGYCFFDLQNGVKGVVTGGLAPSNTTIQNVGNGWYRCSITYNSGSPFGLAICITSGNYVTLYNGNSTRYVYVWGAQLNRTNSPLVYQQTTGTVIDDYSEECTFPRTAVTATINPDITTTANDTTISSNQDGATYQWIDCNNSYAIIPGETDQSYTAAENGSYAVIVAFDGCTDTSGCVNISEGVTENSLTETVSIFPNPVKDEINFLLNINNSSVIQIDIYNVWGNKILTESVDRGVTGIKMKTKNLINGLYFYVIKANGIEYRNKFIKIE